MVVVGGEVLTVGSYWAKGLEWRFLSWVQETKCAEKKALKNPLNTVQKKKKTINPKYRAKEKVAGTKFVKHDIRGECSRFCYRYSAFGNGMGGKMQLEYNYCA